MVGVRVRSSGSWLDPEASGQLGWKLGVRLWERVQGHQGLFLTLTYRREGYDDAKRLYEFQSQRQDVPLFLRRLGRAIGVNLKGKWLCKLEFQSGGWVHFHIVLLGVTFIDHKILTRCWRHGHVWVSKLNKRNCFYLTKYVAKNDKIPCWLYGERPRSVKIVRVSEGFWEEVKPRKAKVQDDYDRYGPGPPMKLSGIYTPIGLKIAKSRGVVVRSKGRYRVFHVEPAEFLARMGRSHRFYGREKGWNLFCGGIDGAIYAAAACTHRSGPEAKSAGMPPPPGGGLHLKENSNPDARWRMAGWGDKMPWWIEQGLIEETPTEEELWASAA